MRDRDGSHDGRNEGNVRQENDEWDGWTHPTVSRSGEHEQTEENVGPSDERASGSVPWKSSPSERSRTPREVVRTRLNLTDRQWYVVETLLLVAPYPLFVVAYLTFPIDETVFLVSTLLYSLFATYVGMFS